MFTLILTLATILSALRLRKIMNIEDREVRDEVSNGATWSPWSSVIDHYGLPFGQFCISTLYGIYIRFTFINMILFLLKYVPTGLYMYRCLKSIYQLSRERLKLRQIELEDIQLQIQIVNTKLCVRDSEFTERAEQRRRSALRFMRVRARVRRVIAADHALGRALHAAASAAASAAWDAGHDQADQADRADLVDLVAEQDREDCDFIMELLKELKYDQVAIPEGQEEKMDCGECVQSQPSSPEHSIYSSLSDGDVRQDCRVKIVKVTNVYKVAYLKHYIKQKRLRRANKQAALKKKMDNIKQLLEEWQKTLNMVINTKLSILNLDPHPIDAASQEAMGDYSKPRECSDTDSDLRNSYHDMSLDEYNFSWAQNTNRTYGYGNYEDVPETAVAGEFYDSQDVDSKYSGGIYQGKGSNRLSILEELRSETGSEDINGDNLETAECRDLIAL